MRHILPTSSKRRNIRLDSSSAAILAAAYAICAIAMYVNHKSGTILFALGGVVVAAAEENDIRNHVGTTIEPRGLQKGQDTTTAIRSLQASTKKQNRQGNIHTLTQKQQNNNSVVNRQQQNNNNNVKTSSATVGQQRNQGNQKQRNQG